VKREGKVRTGKLSPRLDFRVNGSSVLVTAYVVGGTRHGQLEGEAKQERKKGKGSAP
jgi:hypothetical protein